MSADAREDRASSTTVGWFELFYDLVVVAAVSLTVWRRARQGA